MLKRNLIPYQFDVNILSMKRLSGVTSEETYQFTSIRGKHKEQTPFFTLSPATVKRGILKFSVPDKQIIHAAGKFNRNNRTKQFERKTFVLCLNKDQKEVWRSNEINMVDYINEGEESASTEILDLSGWTAHGNVCITVQIVTYPSGRARTTPLQSIDDDEESTPTTESEVGETKKIIARRRNERLTSKPPKYEPTTASSSTNSNLDLDEYDGDSDLTLETSTSVDVDDDWTELDNKIYQIEMPWKRDEDPFISVSKVSTPQQPSENKRASVLPSSPQFKLDLEKNVEEEEDEEDEEDEDEVSRLESQLEKQRKSNTALKAHIGTLGKEKEKLESESTALKQIISQKDSEVKILEEQIQKLQSGLKAPNTLSLDLDLDQDDSEWKTKYEEVSEKLNQQEKLNQALLDQKRILEEQISTLPAVKEKITRLEKENSNLLLQLDGLHQSQKEFQTQGQTMENKWNQMVREKDQQIMVLLEAKEDLEKELQSQKQSFESMISQITNELSFIQTEKEETTNEMTEQKKKLDATLKTLLEIRDENSTKENALKLAENKLSQVSSLKEELENKNHALMEQMKSLKKQFEDIKQVHGNQEEQGQAQLKELQEKLSQVEKTKREQEGEIQTKEKQWLVKLENLQLNFATISKEKELLEQTKAATDQKLLSLEKNLETVILERDSVVKEAEIIKERADQMDKLLSSKEDEQLNALQTQLKEKETTVIDLTQQITRITQELNSMKEKEETVSEKCKELLTAKQEIQSKLENLQQQQEAYQLQLLEKDSNIILLQGKLEDSVKNAESAGDVSKKIEELKEKNKELQASLLEATQKIESISSDKSSLESKLQGQNLETEHLFLQNKLQLESVENKVSVLVEEKRQVETELEQIREKLRESQKELAETKLQSQSSSSSKEEHLNQLQQSLSSSAHQVNEMKEKIATLQKEKLELSDLVNQKDSTIQQLKTNSFSVENIQNQLLQETTAKQELLKTLDWTKQRLADLELKVSLHSSVEAEKQSLQLTVVQLQDQLAKALAQQYSASSSISLESEVEYWKKQYETATRDKPFDLSLDETPDSSLLQAQLDRTTREKEEFATDAEKFKMEAQFWRTEYENSLKSNTTVQNATEVFELKKELEQMKEQQHIWEQKGVLVQALQNQVEDLQRINAQLLSENQTLQSKATINGTVPQLYGASTSLIIPGSSTELNISTLFLNGKIEITTLIASKPPTLEIIESDPLTAIKDTVYSLLGKFQTHLSQLNLQSFSTLEGNKAEAITYLTTYGNTKENRELATWIVKYLVNSLRKLFSHQFKNPFYFSKGHYYDMFEELFSFYNSLKSFANAKEFHDTMSVITSKMPAIVELNSSLSKEEEYYEVYFSGIILYSLSQHTLHKVLSFVFERKATLERFYHKEAKVVEQTVQRKIVKYLSYLDQLPLTIPIQYGLLALRQ